MSVRAFVAVLLDPATRAALAAEIDRFRHAAPHVTWVDPENLHVTVKFLGNVSEEVIPAVTARLREVATTVGSFELAVEGVGGFPAVTRPRVVWAGCTRGHDAATALAERIDASLEPLGFAREARPFTPHVTLGRVRTPRRDPTLTTALEHRREVLFGIVPVRSLSLMRSDLSPRGARYTELAALDLR